MIYIYNIDVNDPFSLPYTFTPRPFSCSSKGVNVLLKSTCFVKKHFACLFILKVNLIIITKRYHSKPLCVLSQKLRL